MRPEILMQSTARIGVRTVWRIGARYFVSIHNRSYESTHEVPVATALRYRDALTKEWRS